MNKNCKMTIGAMLLLTTAFSAFSANAQTCAVPPTCESLGYDKSADECSGLAQLKCPFDQSKYFCTAYRNAGEGEPIAVGDIAYSDGTYSAVPVPSKTPVGVVFNTSGLVIALLPYKTDIDDFNSVSETMCSSYSSGSTSGWQNPSKAELQSIYANKTKIDATLTTLATTTLGTGKYIYDTGSSCHNHIDFSTGKDMTDCSISSNGIMRCVNTLAKIAGDTTPTTTYKVGDTYVKDGVALGTVVSVDSTGQHGQVAIARGSVDGLTNAASICNSLTAGGLLWGLANKTDTCKLVQTGEYYASDHTGYVSCTGGHPYTYSSSTGIRGVVCSAPF
ncbi:MAG: hypothetical protein KH081_06625 [Azospirillum sp.]|nr:hypothetical protein [Azospirillum sp.]